YGVANQLAVYEHLGLFGPGKIPKPSDVRQERRRVVNDMVRRLLLEAAPLADISETFDLFGPAAGRTPAGWNALLPGRQPRRVFAFAAKLLNARRPAKSSGAPWDAPFAKPALPKRPAEYEQLVDPYDPSAPLDL